nr:hypothetical protein [Candidatus Njordarchaeum guaymaensis]
MHVKTMLSVLILYLTLTAAVAYQDERLSLLVSTNKYEYQLNEQIVVNYWVNKACDLKIYLRWAEGYLEYDVIKAAPGYSTYVAQGMEFEGVLEVGAQGSVGPEKAQAKTFILVTDETRPQLMSLPSGGRANNNTEYSETLILRNLDLNLTSPEEDQSVTVDPEEEVKGRLRCQVWSLGLNSTQRWQLFLLPSWTAEWPPPIGFLVYDGVPGEQLYLPAERRFIYVPSQQIIVEFTIKVPKLPGMYFLWFCFSNELNATHAFSKFTHPLTLPAHARIIVKYKIRTRLELIANPSNVEAGEEVSFSGFLKPALAGAPITLNIWRASEKLEGAPQASVIVITREDGSFSHRWTSTIFGEYQARASYGGSRSHLPADGEAVRVTIRPVLNLTPFYVAVMIALVAALTIYARRKPRLPTISEVLEHLEEARKYVRQGGKELGVKTRIRTFLYELLKRLRQLLT